MNLNKTERLRIVFMGTPGFAVATLANLVEHEYDIAGVITAPDRPAGRGRKLQESAIKKYALQEGIQVMQPTNLKDSDFLETLKSLHANLFIVVAFRMLPKAVWAMPKYGTFNLHASLLPNYRGAAPINWAILNGETETGVTTFFIDDKIDTGEITQQKKIKIQADDTAGTLHDKLMVLGADLVLETVGRIKDGSITRRKQEHLRELKPAHKIHKDTCKIDWKQPIDKIHNHIRGLSPYPASWSTMVNEGEHIFIKIYSASKEAESHTFENGKVFFDKKEMKVAVNGGYIKLLEIQLPGKRRMKTSDVLNGLNLTKSAYMV
ncbi:Methionyl-tRNA formyltransferase [hydrothermal vent metagenome]|uniref:methionyl-tRNA formyltransferase n=1 Tax=hydrothermal vent metagenome TaxID=652676 RepID=A0A3B0TJU7_9ZZZZ